MSIFELVQIVVGGTAIFVLPGSALLALGRRKLAFDWVETLCMAVGLSLAAIPLSLYAMTLLGIPQGTAVVLGLLVLCALITAWDWRDWRATFRPIEPQAYWLYAALGLTFLFTLIGRLWSIQGLEYPLWTDSYGHSVLTQMVVDARMVPTTYEPYAPIHDYTYHFGFHTLAAWFYWVTALPVPQSVLIAGQILNALVVPTTYIFGQRLFNRRSAGVAAAVIAGLLSHMPAQFVNWGRYTQLDGQILLPVAMVLYLIVLRTLKPDWRVLLLTALAFAGLFFSHYRIFVFGALFILVLFAMAFLRPKSWGQKRSNLLLNSVFIAVMGLLVLSPWIWRLAKGFGGAYARKAVSGYQADENGDYFGFAFSNLTDFGVYGYLWAASALAVLWGLWRREPMVMALLLWVVALFAGANLYLINFTPLYSNTIVIIALYLPVAALCGYLVSEAANWLLTRVGVQNRGSPLWEAWLCAAIVLMGVYGVWRDTTLVAHDNAFVRAGDVAAMQWVRQEIPQDALFYIATFFWTPEVAHGLDGGYYLPLLAARQTIMPLQNYASDGTVEYRALVNQRLRDLAAATDIHALAETMRKYGITHVYIGARPTSLNAQSFTDDPADFEMLYNKDNVWIFAVRGGKES